MEFNRQDIERLAKIESNVSHIKELLENHVKATEKQNDRIVAVERRLWTWGGFVSLLAFAAPIAVKYII